MSVFSPFARGLGLFRWRLGENPLARLTWGVAPPNARRRRAALGEALAPSAIYVLILLPLIGGSAWLRVPQNMGEKNYKMLVAALNVFREAIVGEEEDEK